MKETVSIVNGDYEPPETTSRKPSSLRRKRRRRRRRDDFDDYDIPFWMLVLQVGATIFILCAFLATLLRWTYATEQDDDDEFDDDQVDVMEIADEPQPPTEPSLPDWTLSETSRYDAFGIAERYGGSGEFWEVATTVRNDFSDRYGGENAARAILERALSTFATTGQQDVEHTACRIREASEQNRPFKFAFGGYSVTVGRGNYFQQSFPFVMERILKRLFEVLGVSLQVRNAAIGGIPSFPYGWCMENFWGKDPDVVSWDYSMNEAGGVPQGLEAYVRHVMMLDRAPKLIVKDTHMAEARRNLLKAYAESGAMVDSVVVHTDPAATPFLQLSNEKRPYGFNNWRNFGSPPGSPGQALHHPAVKEHEFIAWVLAMHFLSSLELFAADQSENILNCAPKRRSTLPLPLSADPTNNTVDWFSLLFGYAVDNEKDGEKWTLNRVHCRTSFEPILQGSLESIVVSGTFGNGTDIMQPKGAMFYSQGWVLDLSDEEKLAKRKLDRFDGLGYVDSKKAYYGIYASGLLRLFLPYEGSAKPNDGDRALDLFRSIIFCEVNEKRIYGSCNAEKHLSFTVGGVNATISNMIDSAGTLYYGKKLCLYVPVPPTAKLSLSKNTGGQSSRGIVGLTVEIQVNDMHIMKKELACSLSHVIWEEAVAAK